MATEAQKLIGLSLTKIAQSRMNRGGISLHKNLLVATVLQKARFVFMEEAYAASYNEVLVPQTRCCKVESTAADHRLSECRDCDRPRRHKRQRDDADDRDEPAAAGPGAAKRSCDRDRPRPLVQPAREEPPEPMEVERITSLVSVFSFGANSNLDSLARLGRSVSTPDFCSAQAKELDNIQRRTAFAMAV